MRIQVFDPPMCCSTGVCGPSVDSALVQFAADLAWLESQGVTVDRFNLSQQPQAFVSTPLVKESLAKDGNDCLPLILVDGRVASKGQYPSRQALAAFAQVPLEPAPKPAASPCCCGPRPSTKGAEKRGGGCC